MNRCTRAVLIVASLLLPAGCSYELKAEKKPTISAANLTYCNADQTFVVTGTGLSPMVRNGATEKAELEMPKVCMTRTADADGKPVSGEAQHCLKNEDVQWISQTEIRFTLHPEYGLSPGTYDITVTNPDGSQASGTIKLKVLPGEVLVFWADPSIIYNGVTTQATVYGTNLSDVKSVAIRDAGFKKTTVESKPVGTRQNRVLITVPTKTAAGTYDVVVETSSGCVAELKGGLRITDTRDDKLVTAVDPTFGWTQEETPITITGAGFLPVPRVYLNPHTPGPGSAATALSSVALKDEKTITAVVPKGLPAAAYDLIVVNSDGKVAVLNKLPGAAAENGGFFIIANAPPVVTSVSPLYVTNQQPQTVTIDGSGFNNPKVTLSCRKPDGSTVTLAGTTQGAVTPTSFQSSLPVTNLPGGTVCLLTVTNPDNSYFVFSAIGVSNPSANLNAMIEAPAMATARRAPAVSAGRATRAARFLYAIGGDDGKTAGALNSVETAPIDVYGTPGAWFAQPVSLPAKRTLAGITRVGRFLYLVGGNDGAAPTTSVLRAEVLSPLNAPNIVDVGARRSKVTGEGIGKGIWYYRVSAVMADNDASNPGGETLASDPIAVNLSPESVGDRTIALTLYWEPIPNAKAYRIYRSPNGTENLDGVRMIAEVPGGTLTSYEDKAAPGKVSGGPPRPLGATGNWATMPSLGGPREAAGVAAAQDPADPNKWHVYALGGRAAAALATWERLTVTVDPTTGVQTVAPTWTAGSAPLSAPRAELTAYSVSHVDAIQVPAGTTYVYAGGGAGSNNVDAGLVGTGGDLTWKSVKGMSPARSGYAGVAGAGFLFAFGGAQVDGSDNAIAAGQIEVGAAPALANWNNNAEKLKKPRYLAGGAVESAFIYVVGGLSAGAATAATERTVL